MGNYTSSCFFVHSTLKAKLVDANGNLRQVNLPIKAAEVMLEEPGHVISPVDGLLRTRRISAMRADDELLAGKLYMFVPINRVNGKVTEKDISIIEAASDKKKSLRLRRRKRSNAKVLPTVTEEVREDREESDQVTVLRVNDTGFASHRFKNQKQWNPVLEAISEVY
ncbi:hypothetical protein Patl1_00901 [Pistacia atlantica]|uniref:Uncharacterized protein n=1 Tax=Pistacia atlantica TaxID=434234 RepID=A0ACC1CBU5_9ROSI|nr:hypothetical protein Patl1_00901 [Pistacia atlantica]